MPTVAELRRMLLMDLTDVGSLATHGTLGLVHFPLWFEGLRPSILGANSLINVFIKVAPYIDPTMGPTNLARCCSIGLLILLVMSLVNLILTPRVDQLQIGLCVLLDKSCSWLCPFLNLMLQILLHLQGAGWLGPALAVHFVSNFFYFFVWYDATKDMVEFESMHFLLLSEGDLSFSVTFDSELFNPRLFLLCLLLFPGRPLFKLLVRWLRVASEAINFRIFVENGGVEVIRPWVPHQLVLHFVLFLSIRLNCVSLLLGESILNAPRYTFHNFHRCVFDFYLWMRGFLGLILLCLEELLALLFFLPIHVSRFYLDCFLLTVLLFDSDFCPSHVLFL